MKVALIVDQLRVGGKERVVATLGVALARRGVDVCVIALQRADAYGAELCEAGCLVCELDSRRGTDLPAVARLARLLRKFDPDVIHLHDRSSVVYGLLAAKVVPHARRVMTAHGLLKMQDSSPRAGWLERRLARSLDALVGVADDVAADYAQLWHYGGEVSVVANGIAPKPPAADARERLRAEMNIPPDAPMLLAVGNIKPEKAYDDLLDAFARVDSPEARLVIAGGGNSSELEALFAKVAALGVESRTVLLGQRSDTADLYAAADGMVLSSRSEGLPMVVLEAAAAGLPLVATAVGDVPDVLAGGAGVLVRPGLPSVLAEAINHTLADPQAAAQRAARAKQTVETLYSATRMAGDYFDLYQRLAAPDSRDTVIQLAPQFPQTGGMASVADVLAESPLNNAFQMKMIPNGKRTAPGRSLLAGVVSQLRLGARVMRTVLRARRPIVHLHTCSGMTFWRDTATMLLARLCGARGVWHIHGGQFGAFANSRSRLRRWAMGRALQLGREVICLSDAAAMTVRSFCRRMPQVIPNGVLLSDATEMPDDPAPMLLFLGHLGESKGTRELIEAAAILRDRGIAFRMTLAGCSRNPDDRKILKTMLDELDLRKQVTLPGMIRGRRKTVALQQASAVVLPSHSEAYPMVLLEAFAAARPVVATRVGAVEQIVAPETGLLVEPRNVQALADALETILASHTVRASMGRAGRARCEAHFCDATMARRMAGVYRRVRPSRERTLSARGVKSCANLAAEHVETVLARAIARRGVATVALSGGNSPRELHRVLVSRGKLDVSRIHFFFGDERTVAPDDPESNYRMATETLLTPAGVEADHIHRIQAEGDPAKAAAAYERELRRVIPGATPKLDLVILGLGEDGHTASLFPGTAALGERERLVVANDVPQQDTTRITMTFGALEAARDILFFAPGDEKRAMVEAVRTTAVELPAARLATRDNTTWVISE
ncbi:MAG: 6-phosphogluconolactonase [Phycisphaerales bacterium]|nr:6-phosphogluconolactonase [Phycisphaerales bacterium]